MEAISMAASGPAAGATKMVSRSSPVCATTAYSPGEAEAKAVRAPRGVPGELTTAAIMGITATTAPSTETKMIALEARPRAFAPLVR